MSLINKIIICASLLVFIQPAFAQENDLFLIVSPSSPAPGQGYSVEANSSAFDAQRAHFEWFKNGKKIDEGTGILKKIFGGEKSGTQTKIAVTASANGQIFSATAQININEIDFIINPLTYTPFTYRGSALATPGSAVEIYAIPHIFSGGRRINHLALTYQWTIEGNPVLEQSGRGKNVFTAVMPKTPRGEISVSLEVFSGEQFVAQKRERISIYSPEIIFYRTNSLLGKSQRAIYELVSPPGSEFAISAEPFFFDFNSIINGVISWFGNGAKIDQQRAGNLFVLELTSPPNEESQNSILFKIEDEKNIFQNKQERVSIKIKQ